MDVVIANLSRIYLVLYTPPHPSTLLGYGGRQMFQLEDFRPENPADIFWDVGVIGTGMGGAPLESQYTLCRKRSAAGYLPTAVTLDALYLRACSTPESAKQAVSPWEVGLIKLRS
jgi:hypothetical protein